MPGVTFTRRRPVRKGGKDYVPPIPNIDDTERQLTGSYHGAIEALAGSVDSQQVIDAITARKAADAVAAFDWDRWREMLTAAQGTSAEVYMRAANTALQDGLLAGVAAPEPALAAHWAEVHGAKMVADIDTTTRDAIAQVVKRSLDEGWSVDRAAKSLRDVVGLNPRQAQALANYRGGLLDKGTTPAHVDSLAGAYRDRLVKQRAQTIAQHEIMTAANAGRYEAWMMSVAQGAIGPDAMKEWIASPDSCPICVDLDGMQVPIDEDFGDAGSMPPAHVSCRCTAVISDPGTTGYDGGAELDDGG